MAEATNFVEKALGVSLDKDKNLDPQKTAETSPEIKEQTPIYTPPPPRQPMPEFIPPQINQQPVIQIIEKVVYKKQRIHGFFRTLTIIALLAIGFLMLGESTGLMTLSANSFKLNQVFPLFIIFSTIIIRSYKGVFGKVFGLILFLGVFGGIFTIGIYTGLNPSSKWKAGDISNYDIVNTGQTNIYVETLIGNSYIEGNNTNTGIQSTWNSDRSLLVSSGTDSIHFNEDSNRNVLQKYTSKIDLMLPLSTTFDLLYIKNFLGLHTIDLTTLQRKTLKFHAGINDITLKIGNVLSGNKIEIQGTAANIELDIPKDIGVNMYYNHLVGKLQAPEFYMLTGHYLQSNNMATAKAILNIYINLGAGNTKINRTEPK